MTDKELYIKALKAMEKAYAPYSGFCVGAAVLTKCGVVFTGCNIENSAYGTTICAERVAMSKAISEGYKHFDAIAVASNNGYAYPCGTCRQFIFEFGDDIRVIVGNEESIIHSYTIEELLPFGFRLENGK